MSIKTQTTFLIFLVITDKCQLMPEKLKKLREKANAMQENVHVMTESTRGASLRFVPKSDILYPGLDKEKQAKVRKLWEDYYDCQEALYESTKRLVVPEAVAFLEGSNAVMECEICESPRDMFLNVRWMFSKDYKMENIAEINLTSSIFIKDNKLNMYNIGENRGGLYVCQKGNHSARPYVVHVFKSEPSKKVVSVENEGGEHAASDVNVAELGVKVTTMWADWTLCSRCDQIGKRYRHGICTVQLDKNTTVFRAKRSSDLSEAQNETATTNEIINQTSTETSTGPIEDFSNSSTDATSVKNEETSPSETSPSIPPTSTKYEDLNLAPTIINANTTSLKEDLIILDIFEEGIPCRSRMLSSNVRNHPAIANRSSEVLEAYCKIPCPKNVVFVVVDEKGKVLETANNSDGVFSVLQGLPKEVPTVSRAVMYAQYGQPFTINCPGNRNGDIPIEWYIGKKALTNKILEKETKGRINIDEYNRIVFNATLFEDSRIFSCWQYKELVGTVRLVVEKGRSLKFEKPVMVIGTIVIFGVFFRVYYKAFTLS